MVELLPEITQALKLTPAERAARGKAARKRAPRSVARARGQPPAGPAGPGRPARGAGGRPGRRTSSPSATDACSSRPAPSTVAAPCSWRRTWPGTPDSGLTAQLCGDAHLMNFGLFQSPERRLVFDINDFDETLPGPVGVGRQASRGELRDRGARPRVRRADAPLDRPAQRARLSRGACWRWPRSAPSSSGTRGSTPTSSSSTSPRSGGKDAKRMAKDMSRAEMKHDLRALSRLTDRGRGQDAAAQRPAAARPGPGAARGRRAGALHARRGGGPAQVPGDPAEGPAGGVRPLPLPRHGAQGRRRRQRRHARVGHPVLRPRRGRPAVPAGQAGAGLGAGALRRAQPVPQRRPARGRGPAADAGRRRHPARLVRRHRVRRQALRLLRAPALGRQGRRSTSRR